MDTLARNTSILPVPSIFQQLLGRLPPPPEIICYIASLKKYASFPSPINLLQHAEIMTNGFTQLFLVTKVPQTVKGTSKYHRRLRDYLGFLKSF